MSESSLPLPPAPSLPLTLEAAHQEIYALRGALHKQQERTAASISDDTQTHLTVLLSSLHEGFLLLDENDCVVLLNQACCELLELPYAAGRFVGMPSTELFPLIAAQLSEASAFQAAATASYWQVNPDPVHGIALPMRKGRILELDVIPQTDTAGRRFKLLHFCNVTERYRIEEQLRMLSRIPQQNPNPVLRYGRDQQRLYRNPAADRLAEELPAEELPPLRDQMHAWAALALDQGTTGRYELSVGGRFFNACMVPNSDGDYVSVYLMEVTDLKNIQHTLADREKRYRDLQHYTQAIICTHSLDGSVLSANPALTALIGCSEQELIGRSVASVMPPEDEPVFAEYLQSIEQEIEKKGVQRVQSRHSSEIHHLLYHSVLVREANEEPYVIVHSHVITERVKMEKVLRQAKRDAENAARARTNFLANMSHEIRTPLNGVLGMAARLEKTALNTQQRELVSIIRASGQHLLTVINDVLDIAKITSGKLELNLEAFNLCDSMRLAVQPLGLQAAEKGIQLEGTPLSASCPYPYVLGDAHRLNQILINLVSNAIKFTPAGGRIRVDGQLLSETEATLTVEFRVTDTGVGIAADKLERIFESFTQAYADTSRNFGGTGLGLSISKALVQQMGGTLSVHSAPGQGSTFAFRLTLPRTLAPPSETPTAEYDTGALRNRRMLLVEDNEINRVVARMLLEEWGVVLDEAEDGPAALLKFEQNQYELILMDIQLPGMNGMAVTAAMRQHADPVRAAVPIVALTANAFLSDTEQYLAAGMNDCAAKPFEETLLFDKLVRLLTPQVPLYDLVQLRALARGKQAFVQTLVRSFLSNIPTTLAELQAASAAGNWTEMARLVHHIKPNLLAFGIQKATPLVLELEQMRASTATGLDASRAQAVAAELTEIVRQVLHALPAELETSGL